MSEENNMSRRQFMVAGAAVMGFPYVLRSATTNSSLSTKERKERLAEWIVSSFRSDDINLLPNMPSGKTKGGKDRPDLKNLYWLQNSNLFAINVLTPYDKNLVAKIRLSYNRWYKQCFADVDEFTDHYLPLAKLPKVIVPAGKYPRAVIKLKDQGEYSIGTETHDSRLMGNISDDSVKVLLKHGVLRSVLEEDKKQAKVYFDSAMKLWDGNGFVDKRGENGHYLTSHLAYALIAANALHVKLPDGLHEKVEQRLWACQDLDGGIWTKYNADGSIPNTGKKTNEIAPLTLLAYDQSIWA